MTKGLEEFISRTQERQKNPPIKNPLAKKFVAQNEQIKAPKLGVTNGLGPSTLAPPAQSVGGVATNISRIGSGSTINEQQTTIGGPQQVASTLDSFEGGNQFDAIKRIGQSATNLENAKYERQMSDQTAQSGGGAGGFMDYYDPSLAGSGGGGGPLPGLDAEQSQIANQIIQIGRQKGMSEQDIQIAIMTGFTESGLRNLKYGDRDSQGIFQQRPSQGWGSVQQVTDPNYSINKFYDTLKGTGRGANPWNTAQNVQRSFDPTGSNFQKHWNQAQQVYKHVVSRGAVTAPKLGANGSASWIASNDGRYHDYDGQFGAQCVDLYNFYTSGFVGSKPVMAGVVGAKDIWNRHDPNAYARVAASQRPQMGDVVIWGGSWGGGYGHVGIVQGVNPNGTLRVLNANATSLGPRGNTVVSNLGTNGLLGYLRPRKLMR